MEKKIALIFFTWVFISLSVSLFYLDVFFLVQSVFYADLQLAEMFSIILSNHNRKLTW